MMFNATNAPLFHKRKSFKHEQEFRAVISVGEDRDGSQHCSGIYCDVDLDGLIEAIVVAPLSDDWFMELVRTIADRKGIGERVQSSSTPNATNDIALFIAQ